MKSLTAPRVLACLLCLSLVLVEPVFTALADPAPGQICQPPYIESFPPDNSSSGDCYCDVTILGSTSCYTSYPGCSNSQEGWQTAYHGRCVNVEEGGGECTDNTGVTNLTIRETATECRGDYHVIGIFDQCTYATYAPEINNASCQCTVYIPSGSGSDVKEVNTCS